MKLKCMFLCYCLTLITTSCSSSLDQSSGWSKFRGPDGNGISKETGLLKEWPENGPKEIWRKPIGTGFSGMNCSENKLYTMDSNNSAEFLLCLNPENGEEIWRTEIDSLFKNSFGDGPRATPTIDGKTVYAISSWGKLVAANKSDGKIQWQVDLKDKFDMQELQYWWGFSMSPFIDGDMLLLQVGGSDNKSIVALNKNNGETIWTTHSDVQAYSTPTAIDFNGARQFIVVSGNHVVSVSPDGSENWKYPWEGSIIKVAKPIFIPPDKIFVSAAYDIGAVLLKMKPGSDSTEVSEVWKSKVMSNHFNSSVLIGGFLYGFDNGTLKCVKAESGEQTWAKRRLGKGSLIYADGNLIVLGERGQLVLLEANSDEYIEKGRTQVLKGKTWTSPTLDNGKLYLRHQKEIVCLDLKELES